MSIASHVLDRLDQLRGTYDHAWGPGGDGLIVDAQGDEMVRYLMEPDLLASSALVWIAPEMVALLKHAATSLPLYTFHLPVLPWPDAVIIAATPLYSLRRRIGHVSPCTLLTWATVGNGAFVNFFNEDETGTETPAHTMILADGKQFDVPAVNLETGEFDVDWSEREQQDMGRLLCALWLLLKQRVAIQRKAIPSRGDHRRWIRQELGPIPEVTIVELRRPLNTEPFKGESGFVDWSHRWIVDGHWRNQYHPSTQQHIPTWIAPYVKGPDDKPLVVSRKVHAWTR